MNDKPKLLIRTDANPQIGTGKVIRCIELATAWRELQGETTFVCTTLPRGLEQLIVENGFRLFQIRDERSSLRDVQETLDIASIEQPDWVLLDGERFDLDYQRLLAEQNFHLACIAPTERNDNLGLVVNAHFSDPPSEFPADFSRLPTQKNCEQLNGIRYVLKPLPERSDPHRIVAKARRFVVCLKGDHADLFAQTVLRTINQLNHPKIVVDCLLSGAQSINRELLSLKRNAKFNLRFHRNHDRLSGLLDRCDLMITNSQEDSILAVGLGVPQIVLSSNSDATDFLALIEAQVALPFHLSIPCSESSSVQFRREIIRLVNDREKRQQMSESAGALLDGKGPDRVACRMLARLFKLQEISNQHSNDAWRWQNDPEHRAVSFESSPVTFGTFEHEFHKLIRDQFTRSSIAIDHNQEQLAQITIQWDSNRCGLLDLVMNPDKRGRNWESVLIGQAVRNALKELPIDRLECRVKPGDQSLLNALNQAGFQSISPTTVNGQLAMRWVFEPAWYPSAPSSFRRSA